MDTTSCKFGHKVELRRAGEADLRAPAFRGVDAFDGVEHVGPRLVTGPVDLPADPLGLLRREEALHRGVVPDDAGPAHRARDTDVRELALELLTGSWLLRSELRHNASGFPRHQIAMATASMTGRASNQLFTRARVGLVVNW